MNQLHIDFKMATSKEAMKRIELETADQIPYHYLVSQKTIQDSCDDYENLVIYIPEYVEFLENKINELQTLK